MKLDMMTISSEIFSLPGLRTPSLQAEQRSLAVSFPAGRVCQKNG
jgi:hypothetical protein